MSFERLCELLAEIAPVPETICLESRLSSDLGLCSFDMMLLLLRIEESIAAEIDTSALKSDMTLHEILTLINGC